MRGITMTIGENILKYRKQAGLSQEELADKMNVSRQSVSLWETDQTTPSLESLRMLAEIFAVSLDELCGTPCKEPDKAQPDQPEKPEYLASVQTQYTIDLCKRINEIRARKFYTLIIIAFVLSTVAIFNIALTDADKTYLIVPIFWYALLIALTVWLSLSLKKRTAEFMKLHPNCAAKVMLFQNHLEIEVTSDNTNSKSSIQYSDIKKVQIGDQYILLYYGNTVVPIAKNLPDTNYDLIHRLLSVPNQQPAAPKNKRIKALLLAMFILSLLTIFVAMIVTGICAVLAPLPDYMYTMPEYMWILLLFLPLPLASLILGIVFLTKKYRCLKNVIGGAVMCVLLAIFGSFTFLFADYNLHDYEYVHVLEKTISIDLPDSGYISRAKNPDSTTQSLAMIKFDDKNEFCDTLLTDGRFRIDMNFIPPNFIALQHAIRVSDYDYFLLYDVTGDQFNTIPESQTVEHRFIFLAYHIDNNILFVLDFIK